jgi:dethiobiotin synthetase
MSEVIVVAGTDTDVGKTIFSAGLTRLLDGIYWKPVQAGLSGETDAETVGRLSGLSRERILPESWRLHTAASPHLAAQIDGITIDAHGLSIPAVDRQLIVECAGGLLVPLTHSTLMIDVLARWQVRVVLCARTRLGTINHTLLSIEALRRRSIPLLGVALIGDEHAENARIIAALGNVRILGRLPYLNPLTAASLATAFAAAFPRDAFA